jgi:hypothetical protein
VPARNRREGGEPATENIRGSAMMSEDIGEEDTDLLTEGVSNEEIARGRRKRSVRVSVHRACTDRRLRPQPEELLERRSG